MARGLNFWIKEVEVLYYLCGENIGADQLAAQLICTFVLFSHMQNSGFLMMRLRLSAHRFYNLIHFVWPEKAERAETNFVQMNKLWSSE